MLAPMVAMAAIDGDLATSSSGQIGVSVDLAAAPKLIRISGLDDVNFDKTVGDNALGDQTVEACVYMDTDGTYSVQVDAEPLVSGADYYPYGLKVTTGGVGADELDLSIADEAVGGSMDGLMPAQSANCGVELLDFIFEDDGASVLSKPFSAAAVVNITVAPE